MYVKYFIGINQHFLQFKSYKICVHTYVYILYLLFLIAAVKCYFDMESQIRKDILKLELEQNVTRITVYK